ncbi:amidase [Burkholderiales bacterium]|nr:amidase [Burkholderiales bacterium]
MADELWRWDASRIAAAIAAREVSSREAVAACIGRMHAVNGAINAVTVDLSGQATADADRADAAVRRGEPLGPLHGVPVTIKENVDQAGCATTNGVVAYRDAVAHDDNPVVANLRKAGAIAIGRTNTPAFSFRLDTVNELRGRTHNPWRRGVTPGGSSGGAAASVAAGIVPLAHGNDIAGSVRYPAFCCGLAGLRPSFGRIPAWQPSQKAERVISAQLMSVQGPIARTVRDVRLGLAAMAAGDPRDPWWVPVPLEGPPLAKRVAVVRDAAALDGVSPSPPIARALDDAARWLAEAGYEIVDDPTPGFTEAARLWFEMLVPEFRRFMQEDFERDGDEGIRIAMAHLAALAPDLTPDDHLRALARRTGLQRDWWRFLDRTPVVLAPVCAVPAYGVGFDVESGARTERVWRECSTLMAVPVLGLPGMAVATGLADGLPVGVQIVGPRFREDLCLAAAEAIESRAGFAARLPVDPA